MKLARAYATARSALTGTAIRLFQLVGLHLGVVHAAIAHGLFVMGVAR